MSDGGERLVLGMGASSRAEPDAATAFVRDCLARAGVDPGRIACLATLDRKGDAAAILAVARALSVPVERLPANRLALVEGRLTSVSARAKAATGLAGVAEAAALSAAGDGACLLLPRQAGAGVTCAIAGGAS